MFCSNCGKEINENVKFCHYCGAEQTATVIPAASVPVSADTESSVPISIPAPSEPVSVPDAVNAVQSEQTDAPDVTSIPVAPSEQPAAFPQPISAETGVPTPNSIPTSNIGETVSAPVLPSYPPVNAKKQKKPRERKYTLGHLVMCLIAAGVMAIAAGVFAGLYFSVI